MKTEDSVDGDPKENEYREQVKILYKYRDKLKTLDQAALVDLLEENRQDIPIGKDNVSVLSLTFFLTQIF